MMESAITAKMNISILERWAPWFAVLWLLYVMNSIFAWFSFSVILRVVATTGVVLVSVLLKNYEITRKRGWIAFLTCVYYIWAAMKMDHFLAYLSVTMTFVPFMFIVFWPKQLLMSTYKAFRKVVIFFAIGSTIITFFSYFVDLSSVIPHFEMESQSALHENRNDYYYVYGIFPELNGIGFNFHRACGMMEEPGHFSIVLGFVYMIDRYLHCKINPAIVIGAIFTFSSTFFLMLLFTEFWNIIIYWKKSLLYLLYAIITGVIIYKVLPQDLREMINYLAYERNLEQVAESYDNSGSLNEALDQRASDFGRRMYDNLSFEQKLVGGEWDDNMVLSDYRGLIATMGYIGLGLVLLISLLTLIDAPPLLKVSLFFSLLMIMLHRSWFFYEPFPYFMSFMASSLYQYNQKSS